VKKKGIFQGYQGDDKVRAGKGKEKGESGALVTGWTTPQLVRVFLMGPMRGQCKVFFCKRGGGGKKSPFRWETLTGCERKVHGRGVESARNRRMATCGVLALNNLQNLKFGLH